MLEILRDFLPLIGSVASCIISFFIARATASNEIKKLEMSWNREDVKAFRNALSEVAVSISKYIDTGEPGDQECALQKVEAIRPIVPSYCAESLEKLRNRLIIGDTIDVDQALSELLQNQRYNYTYNRR